MRSLRPAEDTARSFRKGIYTTNEVEAALFGGTRI